ncbi:MAG: CinA family protein [Clostridia bacterium]|nr:CinA family protein [Clostridia bacterium]
MELKELAEKVVKTLIEKNLSFSAAESMTGGLFTKTFTDVPGASKVLDRGIVSYSKRAKAEELNVNLKEISLYGVVSKEVANLMATGLANKTGSKICISVTGVAGPGPDEGIPAGTFYVGLYSSKRCRVTKFELGDLGREEVRNQACYKMFELIDQTLQYI